MGDWGAAQWIPLCAVAITIVLAFIGYLRSPPLIPASRVIDLNKRVSELQAEVKDLRDDVARLTSLLDDKMQENYWLQRRLRAIEDKPQPT